MKKLIVVAGFALGAIIGPRPAAAGEGCSPVGSWMTQNPLPPYPDGGDFSSWMTTVTGQGNAGTIETEIVQWPLTQPLPPELPPGTRVSTLRGVWKRTGGNVFAFTQVGLVFAPDGTPLFAVRNSGTNVLTENCNLMTVVSTMEFVTTDLQPMIPPVATTVPDMFGHRIVVQPPAVIAGP